MFPAIAQVESSFNPKAVNENKNRAGQVISRDYGLMQINSSWFSKLAEHGINEVSVYEPCLNVSLGAGCWHRTLSVTVITGTVLGPIMLASPSVVKELGNVTLKSPIGLLFSSLQIAHRKQFNNNPVILNMGFLSCG